MSEWFNHAMGVARTWVLLWQVITIALLLPVCCLAIADRAMRSKR